MSPPPARNGRREEFGFVHTKGESVHEAWSVPVVVFAVIAAVGVPLFASPQSVEGVLSDSMCGKKHMLPGKTDAQCIQECIGGNSKYALVVGDNVYTLSGSATEFEKYAGKRVRVTGEIGKDAITVSSIGAVDRH